jgi:hypothetical protein
VSICVTAIIKTKMKKEIMYIELKSGYSDSGPAWIGKVNYSKSGQTVYFDGKAIKYATGLINGNGYDIQTGETYWISGVKKNQKDRHWAGSGKVMIDKDCVDDYLSIIGKTTLDMRRFEVVSLKPSIPPENFHEAENKKL